MARLPFIHYGLFPIFLPVGTGVTNWTVRLHSPSLRFRNDLIKILESPRECTLRLKKLNNEYASMKYFTPSRMHARTYARLHAYPIFSPNRRCKSVAEYAVRAPTYFTLSSRCTILPKPPPRFRLHRTWTDKKSTIIITSLHHNTTTAVPLYFSLPLSHTCTRTCIHTRARVHACTHAHARATARPRPHTPARTHTRMD